MAAALRHYELPAARTDAMCLKSIPSRTRATICGIRRGVKPKESGSHTSGGVDSEPRQGRTAYPSRMPGRMASAPA
ncbi:hypothetical protein I541_5748 [Mycobacteroides abscessus]|nr:hypothetical protein I541_5748 [Mycobacteroides abscessus]